MLMTMDAAAVAVDVDECSGPDGESCRLSRGTCDGFNPPGSFTCHCATGFQLAPDTTTDCIGNT